MGARANREAPIVCFVYEPSGGRVLVAVEVDAIGADEEERLAIAVHRHAVERQHARAGEFIVAVVKRTQRETRNHIFARSAAANKDGPGGADEYVRGVLAGQRSSHMYTYCAARGRVVGETEACVSNGHLASLFERT